MLNSAQLETSESINGVPVQSNNPQLIETSWVINSAQRFFLNGSEDLNPDINGIRNSPLSAATTAILGQGVKDINGNDGWDGIIAEVLVFTSELNAAQRIIVNNYLSAKYGISVPLNVYNFDTTFPGDIAGIGNSGGETHTAAASDTVLQISNPTALNDGDFLLFGHDNRNDNTWTTSEAPGADSNIQRLEREWRVTETGDLGTLTLSVDSTKLPSKPAGLTKFAVLIDSDGDFTDGNTEIYGLDRVGGGSPMHSATGITISDSDFITLAIIRPILDFTVDNSNGFEDIQSNPFFDIELNYIPQSDVTVEYFTTNGSATGVNSFTDNTSDVQDYVSVPNSSPITVTITAGSRATSFQLPQSGGRSIHNDTAIELDEDFTLTLQNPSGDNIIGTNSPHTYVINDDDNPRKIFFQNATASVTEANTTVSVTVEINDADSNPTSADFDVTGGTATGGGTDFNLTSGTATVQGDNTSITTTFDITINDDSFFEGDETLIVELSNPNNANLGDGSSMQPTTFTLTITDNESAPTVEFSSASSFGDESIANVTFVIQQSQITGADTEITFSVGGTATGSGTDFTQIDFSPVTIPAGQNFVEINFNIIEDGLLEPDETITAGIDNASNATIGAINSTQHTILDNDGLGNAGPAGNGNSAEVLLWLRADTTVLQSPGGAIANSDGQSVGEWRDLSGNNHDFIQNTAADQPVLRTNANGINNLPVVEFDGTGQFLEDADGENYINGLQAFTFLFVTRSNVVGTDAGFMDTETPQGDDDVIGFRYDDAGVNSGRNDIMKFGIQTNGTNNSQQLETSETVGGNTVQSTNPQIIGLRWTAGNDLNFLLNGAEDTNENLNAPSADGSLSGSTTALLGVGVKDNPSTTGWNGNIAEVIVYNSQINLASLQIVHNYLSTRYGISLPPGQDIFAHDATHPNDLAGIGRVDINNFHSDSKGPGRVRIFNPSALDNGDFLVWGHDNAPFTTEETDVPAGIDNRLNRVWRVTETGEVGNVNFSIDLAGFTINEGTDIRLLIDRDGNGQFNDIPAGNIINEARSNANKDGGGKGDSQLIKGTLNGTIWTASNSVNFNDGDFFTVASTSNENSLPVTLSAFDVELQSSDSNDALLTWRTETEQENFGFRLERRFTGLSDNISSNNSSDTLWTEIGFVEGQGTKKTPTEYSFSDQGLTRAGRYEFRITQIDFDGTTEKFGPVELLLDVPVKLQLNQNYPNPFNPTTTIPFSVPKTGRINLTIYNTLGQEVALLVDEVRQPGSYQVTFDASSLSSGMYIMRLTGSGEVVTRKLMLIK